MLSCSALPDVLPRTRLVVLDGYEPITGAVARLLGDQGLRLEVGGVAGDAAELAVRTGEEDAIPDLVVLVGAGLTSAARWAPWRALGVPHLPVEYDERAVVVGPLVVPGTACLGCLDLHRRDVRRHALRGELRPTGSTRWHHSPTAAPDAILATMGAAVAAMAARDLVLHRRYLPGVTLEITATRPQMAARRWDPHPRCDCHALGATMVL